MFNRSLSSILILLIGLSLHAQRLTPKVDRLVHTDGVKLAMFNEDESLYLMLNERNVLTVHQVETAKVIARTSLDHQVLTAFFDKETNHVTIVCLQLPQPNASTGYSFLPPSAGDGGYDLLVFQLNTTDNRVYSPVAPININSAQFYEATFSPDRNYVAVSSHSGDIYCLDARSWRVTKSWVDPFVKLVIFDESNNLIFVKKKDDRYVGRSFSPLTGEELSEQHDFGTKLVNRLPDRLSFEDGEDWVFRNFKTEDQIRISGSIIQKSIPATGDHEINIQDVSAFVKDRESGKWIFSGGGATYMTAVIGRLPEVYTDALFYSFDPSTNSLEELLQYSNNFLDRVIVLCSSPKNGETILIDERATQQSINILDINVVRQFDKAPVRETSVAVNSDFSSFIYSVLENNTYELFPGEATYTEQKADTFLRYLGIGDNGNKGGAYTFGMGFKDPNDCFWNLEYPLPSTASGLLDIYEFEMSKNGRSKVFATSILSNYLTLPDTVDIVTKEEFDDGSAFVETDKYHIHYQDATELSAAVQGNKLIEGRPNSVVVFDDNSPEKTIILYLKNGVDKVEVSNNGRFIAMDVDNSAFSSSMDPTEKTTALFDLDSRAWINTFSSNIEAGHFKYFDDDSPYAIFQTDNAEFQLWNSETGTTSIGKYVNMGPAAYGIDQEGQRIFLYDYKVIRMFDFNWDTIGSFCTPYNVLYEEMTVSPKGDFLNLFNRETGNTVLYEKKTGSKFDLKSIKKWSFPTQQINDNLYPYVHPVFWHNDGERALLNDGMGSLELWDIKNRKVALNIELYANGEWLCYNPQGYFDASAGARNFLYYTSGEEPILYSQIKEKYWVPGLMDEVLKTPHLQRYEYTRDVPLYPSIQNMELDTSGKMSIQIKERNGGIGRVALFINNKEVDGNVNPGGKTSFIFSLKDYNPFLYQAGVNKVELQAYNSDGWIGSRRKEMYVETNLAGSRSTSNKPKFGATLKKKTESKEKPAFFGVFVGTSKYRNPNLKLTFADKDAKSLGAAFGAIGSELFDNSRSKIYVLSTEAQIAEELPNKQNIVKSLEDIATKAQPQDIVVLFFSGHGITLEDDFYYLMSGAGLTDLENNERDRAKVTFSSSEINAALKKSAATKQILILDACHSGKIAEVFQGGSKASSSSQEKALEDLQDKTGVYVLASSESNQKSYETEILSQGFLTFSLLDGMSGSYLDENEEIINVMDLFSHTTQTVEDLSLRILGKRQKPVMTVSQQVNTFPVGLKNESLRAPMPVGKWPMLRPAFMMKTTWNDPEKITAHLLTEIQLRGKIDGKKNYFFSKNAAHDEVVRISGVYEVVGSNYRAEWNILKNEEIWISGLSTEVAKTSVGQLPSKILNISEAKLSNRQSN